MYSFLGITLSNDLTWKSHVDNIIVNYAGKIFILSQLKTSRHSPGDPFTKLTWSRYSLYISVVRPTVEYAWHGWHTNLPTYLSDNIEMIQKKEVKATFPGMSYVDNT